MKASPKQQQIIAHGTDDRLMCVASGSVRSGKSAASSAAHAMFTQLHAGEDHLILGFTQQLAERNCVHPAIGSLSVLRSFGYAAKVSSVGGRHIRVDRGAGRTCRIWIMGGGDESAVDRLAGMTLGSALVDEAARLPESVFQMLLTRLSTQNPKLWLTLNPAGTRHWFKRGVVDQLEKHRGCLIHCTMDDNPSLTAEFKQRMRDTMVGHWKKRLIDGEWADASGLCFPSWAHGAAPQPVKSWEVWMDWASSGVFAALLVAIGVDHTAIVAERVYDANQDPPLTDEQHALRTAQWARERCGTGSIRIVGDPSTSAGFQSEIAQRGFWWQDANNDVVEGLKRAAQALAAHEFVIVPGACPVLEGELSEYRWDPRAAQQGIDRPIKTRDHCCDALRYGIFTPIRRIIRRRTSQWR